MIGLINYGAGNIRSVQNAVRWIGGESVVIEAPAELKHVNGVILPGVGAFIPAIRALESAGLADALRRWALEDQRPLLGVCLGMQLMARRGTEGGTYEGLGLMPAEIVRLVPGAGARIPHVGWNQIEMRGGGVLWRGIQTATCYFVHSYQMSFPDAADQARCVTGMTDHAGPIVATVEDGNIMGAQFHPEKSQRDGLDMLRNFIEVAERW